MDVIPKKTECTAPAVALQAIPFGFSATSSETLFAATADRQKPLRKALNTRRRIPVAEVFRNILAVGLAIHSSQAPARPEVTPH